MPIFEFKIAFYNQLTGEYLFETFFSTKGFIAAWTDAVEVATKKLKELDKYYLIESITYLN